MIARCSTARCSTGRTGPAPDADADCFLPGTRILTEQGPIAVERLEEGMWVPMLNAGRSAPVWWMGHRIVDCARHPRPDKVWPVRVARHAFGPGLPMRDLWLSPDHCVFVEQVLIPIRALINRATVAQVPTPEVSYWHVELTAHSIVLAEGMPVETYLDASNRAAFANGDRLAMLHAEFDRGDCEEDECAPMLATGPERDRAERRLAAQALALGWQQRHGEDGAPQWIAPDGTDFRLPA